MRFFGNSWPVVGEFELLVLLALLRLGNGAFGAAIHREIVSRTDRELPASAVYVTLERLEAKRMVVSYIGNPTSQRGSCVSSKASTVNPSAAMTYIAHE